MSTHPNPVPNVFVVGAPKCGTTFWVEHLSRHPDVFFCEPKEPHFLNTDMPGFRWVKTDAEYRALFHGADHRIIGEASVRYLFSSDAARNIARLNPDAKILIFVRDRAAFLRSYHNQQLLNRDEDQSDLRTVWDWSDTLAERPVPGGNAERSILDYKAAGRFAEQVERYLQHFPADQIRVIDMREWQSDPQPVATGLQEFLGIPPVDLGPYERVHGAKRVRSPLLHSVSNRPPAILLRLSALIKKVAGIKGNLGLANWLRSRNVTRGYAQGSDDELAREIAEYFREDTVRLKALVDQHRLGLGK